MGLLDTFTPHARVATAVLPFVVAVVLRLVIGKTRITSLLVTTSTVWFAINVLMAPYSARMQQEILQLRYMFR